MRDWLKLLWPVLVVLVAFAVAWGALQAQVSAFNSTLDDLEPRVRAVEINSAVVATELRLIRKELEKMNDRLDDLADP